MATLEPRLVDLLSSGPADQLLDVVATLRRPAQKPTSVTPTALAAFRKAINAQGEDAARALLTAVQSKTGMKAEDVTLFGGLGSVRLLAPAALIQALADDDRVETLGLNITG